MENPCCAQNTPKPPRPLWKKALLGLGHVVGGFVMLGGVVVLSYVGGHTFGYGFGDGLLDALKPEKTVHQRRYPRPRHHRPIYTPPQKKERRWSV